MSWTDIRNGMATLLGEVEGQHPKAVMFSKQTDNDLVVVLPGTPLLEPSGHGDMYYVYVRVVVTVQRATAEDMQRALDLYVWPTGTESVPAAIMADRTLGGTVEDTEFRGVTGYGVSQDDTSRMQADVNFRCSLEG